MHIVWVLNDNLYEMVNAYYTSLFKESDCEMTTVGNYAERIYSGGTPMTSNAAYWNGTFGWFSSGETRNRFVISTEKTITQAGIDNSSTKLATKDVYKRQSILCSFRGIALITNSRR